MDPRLERRVLDHICRAGKLDAEERRVMEQAARRKGISTVEHLVTMGYLTDMDVAGSIGEVVGLPLERLAPAPEDPESLARLLPATLALRFLAVPLSATNGDITVAVGEPLPLSTLNNLSRLSKRRVRQVIAGRADLQRWLKLLYKVDVADDGRDELPDVEVGDDVVRALDDIIRLAVEERASDIHFEPLEGRMRVRFRVDGVLRERVEIPKEQALQVIARVKVLSSLDIAEKRAPQDGGFTFQAPEEPIDVRVSVMPCVQGEKAVLRLLMGKKTRIHLEGLGLEPDMLSRFKDLITRPHGLILVTGPTGSGKSTTLYAALSMVNDVGVNISTIEDPVEYQMDNVTQTQVDPAGKVTFAKALRSILRQDPDIIMVGEIRDLDTAEIALRSAMTGHLVFSTLHTNDAPSSVLRLVDMGCESFLVASSVIGILAQRLVRVLCPNCREPYRPARDEMELLGIKGEGLERERTWYRPVGCPRCQMTGYKGRMGVFELLTVTQELRSLVVAGAPLERIKETAVSKGMRTLRKDAVIKVEKGFTSVREAVRVSFLE